MKGRWNWLWNWLPLPVKSLLGGAPGTLVYYAVFTPLTQLFGVGYILSAIIGFVPSSLVSFMIQRKHVFQNTIKKYLVRQVAVFFTVAVAILLINLFALDRLVKSAHFNSFVAQLTLTGLWGAVRVLTSYIAFSKKKIVIIIHK